MNIKNIKYLIIYFLSQEYMEFNSYSNLEGQWFYGYECKFCNEEMTRQKAAYVHDLGCPIQAAFDLLKELDITKEELLKEYKDNYGQFQ